MQSCLEKVSIENRHIQEARSDYQRNNQYNAEHKDARSDGDIFGKGTGHGGHGFWTPNCNGPLGVINYSNFDTAISSGAGNCDDNKAREIALARSVYNGGNVYSSLLVDTSQNVREGQYVMGVYDRSARVCKRILYT